MALAGIRWRFVELSTTQAIYIQWAWKFNTKSIVFWGSSSWKYKRYNKIQYMMIWSMIMMAILVLVTAFSMVSLNERTICFSTCALSLWKFLFGKFLLRFSCFESRPAATTSPPFPWHRWGRSLMWKWLPRPDILGYLFLSFLASQGHLCGNHPHDVLVAKLVRAEVKVVDALERVSQDKKNVFSFTVGGVSRMIPEEGSRKVELKWKEDERQEETHFKALPDMRLDPQRILRLTGEFSQAQLQEWEVDQLMWWSKF